MKNKDTALQIFTLVSNLGGTAASCSFSEAENKDISVRNGEVETSNVNRSRRLHLSVWFGKKTASVSGVGNSEDEMRTLVERACAMAKVNQENPFALLSGKSLWPSNIPELALNLKMADSCNPTLDEMRNFALSMEQAGLSVQGVSATRGARVQRTKEFVSLYTTKGFEGEFESTSYGVVVDCIAGTEENMQGWSEGDSVSHFSLLRSPEEMGRLAGETAVALLGASPVRSSHMPVVFDRYVSGSILGHFARVINGELVHQHSSFLNRETLGNRIFPSSVQIVSDPLTPKLLGSFPFDSEGIAGKRIDFVSEGVLQRFITDLQSGAKLGVIPTGSTGNLHMKNGNVSREELIAGIDRGFLVMEFMGKGVNIATGDYSRGASGFLIENGKITRPVNGVTIAGNLRDMFEKIVPANDMVLGRFNVPTLRIDGMMVAGKEG